MLKISKLPILTGLPPKIVLKIGAPCSGKGAEGQALVHLHGKGRYLGHIAMRSLLKAKRERTPSFRSMMDQCEADGCLVPNEHIVTVLSEMQKHHRFPKHVLFFDGIPRDAEQVLIIAHMLQRSTLMVSESVAPEDHLNRVFLATLHAKDRSDRKDAALATHRGRVRLYMDHLPAIQEGIQRQGWRHFISDGTQALADRVRVLQQYIGLQTVSRSKLTNLEKDLDLPPLHLAAAA